MKKTLCLLIAAFMAGSILAGCSGGGGTDADALPPPKGGAPKNEGDAKGEAKKPETPL